METAIYEGKCSQCSWYMTLLREDVVQEHAEEHMMETGHTVQVTEVI